MKQSILEVLHDRFKPTNYHLQNAYEQAWDKFLSFIIEHMPKPSARTPTSTTEFT